VQQQFEVVWDRGCVQFLNLEDVDEAYLQVGGIVELVCFVV